MTGSIVNCSRILNLYDQNESIRKISLSPVYSAPLPGTGPVRSQKPEYLNDSTKAVWILKG